MKEVLRTNRPVDEGSHEIEALDVQFIRPEALGEPGQRRFRLVVVINGRTIVAWMEKEQVGRLGELLQDVLDRLPASSRPDDEASANVIPDESTPDQFRAGRIELSYDDEDDRLIVIIHDIEAETDTAPALSFRLTRGQTRQFTEDADALVTAGRPLCPLCGRAMGPEPHVCEKQNGHLNVE
jgi:uncharacterized repeat protein (TIGR03847 family)